MRGRPQARRLRRPASRLRGLTSTPHRQMGTDTAFRQIWLPAPNCGFDRFRRRLESPVQTFSAEAIDRSERQVNNYVAEGMPSVKIGRSRFIVLAEARPWLLARYPTGEPKGLSQFGKGSASRRGPGRPRKAVAAR